MNDLNIQFERLRKITIKDTQKRITKVRAELKQIQNRKEGNGALSRKI